MRRLQGDVATNNGSLAPESHDSLPDLVDCNNIEYANNIEQMESQNNGSLTYLSPEAKELIEFYGHVHITWTMQS